MEDLYGRKIDYLRISVTDRCNLRCIYCMPPEGIKPKAHDDIIRFEDILLVAEVALEMGIKRFRLTGGEPLVRKGVIPFIGALSRLPGAEDVSLTTNGILLSQTAARLKESGIRRINISLDTMNPKTYRELTRGGDLRAVWEGIEKALEIGFDPVKINIVALRGINDKEWVDFARLTLDKPLHVRFIELMPIGSSRQMAEENFVSCWEVKEVIERELGELTPVIGVNGNGPAEYQRLQGAVGTIGFIHAISEHFCDSCNRLRLTADGKLRPCLFDRREIDLKKAIQEGASRKELQLLFRKAVQLKSANYREAERAGNEGRTMVQIGG
ncbi:MAG: GTP 3',8-cyclase MoaA [Thermacetogeniaceae bacterium]|jgi:cyclic pyranopterin phosphate synthase|nr:GTP 3',8-cyclase MoaA [Syntrophomonadaceae bacterium]